MTSATMQPWLSTPGHFRKESSMKSIAGASVQWLGLWTTTIL
ncbi:hypothetical protein ALP12_102521 [Pseudomonas savastanoi pv. phaseolicola]|uniref:Uncharacterized protein n=1 Tax=Pseudomonas savastanoi pv. phaseolicola TaxID=319 RepID=A0A0Q0BWA9_PSESH|nr:Unknown protein sequence [Pseudomonas savastanoi pv. phaseolicola]RMQ65180.1 hypothetical protein ALQ01_103155 [Pseudomonas savastanoi pv. glycinea]KPB38233.1 Unknown protein sequence [Pseudomonas savastanoi pv. phaseolicola]KPY19595.1 hypothetical protein ALO55_103077 [Pseudomonas savastanoi pv. phaseolicola]RMQ47209.1 hypothetical protein ALQ02_102643 [Pseudomonas savastanoi pv. phaseolicola]